MCPLRWPAAAGTAALIALAACTEPHGAIRFPDDAVEISRPAPYARWWAMTESCSGRSGNLAEMHFYTVPRATIDYGGQRYAGYWFQRGNRIVFAAGQETNGRLARHEMLHALLDGGDPPLDGGDHPRADFVDRCGGIVNFGEPEHEEAAALLPGPAANSPVLSASDFQIDISIDPDPVSLGMPDSGWVTAIVSVTNRRTVPVWARIQRPAQSYAGTTLGIEANLKTGEGGYHIQSGSSRSSIDTLVPFGAGEVKRHALDVQLERGAARWRARGVFNTDTTAWREIVVRAAAPE